MNTEPSRNKAKYINICNYCGKEFNAKRKTTTACDEMKCQRMMESERNRKSYLAKIANEIRYLEHCIRHEMLHFTGDRPNEAKIKDWTDKLKRLYARVNS